MSFLAGMQGVVGMLAAKPPPSVSYIGITKPAVAQNFTLSGLSIGAADETRRVIIALAWNNAVAHRTVSSITMDTVSMGAALVSVVGSSFLGGDIAFYSALKPAGTTADFQINFSGINVALSVAIFRALNENSITPHDTLSDNAISGSNFSDTINIANSGWVIATANGSGTSPTGVTWAGATEQFDDVIDATVVRDSGALEQLLSVQTGRTITATIAATSPGGCLAGISWG